MKGDPKVIQEISTRWNALEAKPFPDGYRAKSLGEKSFTLFQSEVAGFIMAYIQTDGSLGARQRIAIEKAIQELDEVLPELTDEAKEYFGELKELAEIAFKTAHDQPDL